MIQKDKPVMASILPPVPRIIFTILEPISLLAGYLAPLLNTSKFVSSQVPNAIPTALTSTNRVLALQLGNCYGLVGLIGVGVLYATSEPKVVRNYIIACAIADVGHLWATYAAIGHESFMNVWSWNDMAWGNIGITASLLVFRILYLMGLFGQDRVIKSAKRMI